MTRRASTWESEISININSLTSWIHLIIPRTLVPFHQQKSSKLLLQWIFLKPSKNWMWHFSHQTLFSAPTLVNFVLLCFSLFHPHLRYCIQACFPYEKQNFLRYEWFQKLVARMIIDLGSLTYEERLRRRNLFSLVPSPRSQGFEPNFLQVLVRVERRCNCFSMSVVPNWNTLPPPIKEFVLFC